MLESHKIGNDLNLNHFDVLYKFVEAVENKTDFVDVDLKCTDYVSGYHLLCFDYYVEEEDNYYPQAEDRMVDYIKE
jgi:hypothetical protein